MIKIVKQSGVKTRYHAQRKSMVENRSEVLRHYNNEIGRRRITLSNPSRSFNELTRLTINKQSIGKGRDARLNPNDHPYSRHELLARRYSADVDGNADHANYCSLSAGEYD